jgi:hypothetical protein
MRRGNINYRELSKSHKFVLFPWKKSCVPGAHPEYIGNFPRCYEERDRIGAYNQALEKEFGSTKVDVTQTKNQKQKRNKNKRKKRGKEVKKDSFTGWRRKGEKKWRRKGEKKWRRKGEKKERRKGERERASKEEEEKEREEERRKGKKGKRRKEVAARHKRRQDRPQNIRRYIRHPTDMIRLYLTSVNK